MRRKDREITDPQRIEEVVADCHCCRLGFCDEGRAYIVPLNFGYVRRDGGYTFYFHGAKEGRKIDLIRKGGYVAFEMDTHYQLNPGDTACDYSARFCSVVGGGAVSFVETPDEKRAALNMIMAHNTGKGHWEYPDRMIDAVCVFQLEATELSCKEHL